VAKIFDIGFDKPPAPSGRNCTLCQFYKSYREVYDGDRYEPEEYGVCRNEENLNEPCGVDSWCENYQVIQEEGIIGFLFKHVLRKVFRFKN